MATEKLAQSKPDMWAAILAGDAFVAHSEAFIHMLPSDLEEMGHVAAQNLGRMIASATDLALGIELYLKALRLAIDLPIRRIHSLSALYLDIPKTTKEAIEDLYEKSKPTVTPVIELACPCGAVQKEVMKNGKRRRKL